MPVPRPSKKSRKKLREALAKARQRCRIVKNRRGRKRKVCKPVKPKAKPRTATRPRPRPAPRPRPTAKVAVPSPAAPPAVAAVKPAARPRPAPPPPAAPKAPVPRPAPAVAIPAPQPAPAGLPSPPTPVKGALSRRDAERLLWRAGLGPRPGEVDALVGVEAREAVARLTRTSGEATLTGAAPRDAANNPIDPINVSGHDHLWWLDRMVRTDQPFVERMALVWHDWFATSNLEIGQPGLLLDQAAMFRARGLGSFTDLTMAVTCDPAMLVYLNGIANRNKAGNENFARELMELFTLGADRGAYTETDVRELARALTGWRADRANDRYSNFRWDPNREDIGPKTLWAGTPHERKGLFGWQDAVRLCVGHPLHPSFFVTKLWSYFIPSAPDTATQAALEELYVGSGYQIRPVVEAILLHPDLYDGSPLVKEPVIYAAGLLRGHGKTITTANWTWRCDQAGQQLFYPPNVSGWTEQGWLDTATVRGRWNLVYELLDQDLVDPWKAGYSTTETPAQAVEHALDYWGRPTLTTETRAEIDRAASAFLPATLKTWEEGPLRAMRQYALRHLIGASPDLQTS